MDIKVTNQEAQIAVAMRKTGVTMANLHESIDELCGKLLEHLSKQNVEMAGAPYLAYLNTNEDHTRFDIEWGFPVAAPVPVSGEIIMSQNYGGRAITAMYQGSYAGIDAVYTQVMDYARENSLTSTGDYYDYYLNDPDEVPESELLTLIVFPIK